MSMLGIFEAKVQLMTGGVKNWVENQLAEQNQLVQGRLDAFEQRMTR